MSVKSTTDEQPKETFFDGCPDPTAGRAVIIGAGASSFSYTARDSSGAVKDLSELFPAITDPEQPVTSEHSVALIVDSLCPSSPIAAAAVTTQDPESGEFKVELPTAVKTRPGIYTVEVVWRPTADTIASTEQFLLSVEPSLYSRWLTGDRNRHGTAVTLGQVRVQLRDFAVTNTLWDNVEFSDAEIVHSLRLPIQAFNDMPPRGFHYTANSFPYHYQWLEATAANLLRIASNWYLRNASQVKYPDGRVDDTRNRSQPYLALAENKWQQYLSFCMQKKVSANWSYGAYSLGGTWPRS